MDNQQVEPTGIEGIQEPQKALSKEEINTQMKFWWSEIDKQTKFDDYKNAFDKYDYYRDLKQKLYK